MGSATMHMHEACFRNGEITRTARLHLPPDLGDSRSWPAVVLSTPASSIGERAGAIYARKLAARGFVAITFEPSHRRTRAGAARGVDNPATRVAALRSAVDHLASLPFVDDQRIAVLGVFAGGSDAVDAALTEQRFKAVATVAGTGPGRTRAVGARAASGSRHRHASARNLPLLQPLMVVVGGRHDRTGQYAAGRALYGLARGPDRALVVIPGAGPDDLHHRDEHIDPAIERLAPFLHFHLEP